MKQFNEYPPEQLQAARDAVAEDWRNLHRSIRESDPYADHVTVGQKDENLRLAMETADGISAGKFDHQFWAWQRINLKLTGECVALLP